MMSVIIVIMMVMMEKIRENAGGGNVGCTNTPAEERR
jgi:hypothetical protein